MRTHRAGAAIVLLIAALGALAQPRGVSAQRIAGESLCDRSVFARDAGGRLTVDTTGFWYKPRGDRCEGVYRRGVATGFRLHAIYQAFDSIDLKGSRDPLQIEWDAIGDDTVRIQADGILAGQYYRMDTAVPPGASRFTWDSFVMRNLVAGASTPPTRGDISLLGWTNTALGDKVYVPLRIRRPGSATAEEVARCAPVKVVLWVTTPPESVSVTVSRAGQVPPAILADGRPVRQARFRSSAPLEIDVPEIVSAGIYGVEVTAKFGGGQESSVMSPVQLERDRPVCRSPA